MAAATWRYILCESPVVGAAAGTPLVPIGDLTAARDRTVELALNRAGSAGFTIPVVDEMAYEIAPITRSLLITRNSVPVWSGPIATISGSLPDGRMQIRCVGWFDLLDLRQLRLDREYTATNNGGGAWTDAGIAFDLLAIINAQEVGRPTWVSPGTSSGVFQVREKKYTKGEQLGAMIQGLSEIEAGFDYEVDPVTRALNLRAWNLYDDRPEIHFGYNWGPSNIQSLTWSVDGMKVVNHLNAYGNAGMFQFEENITSKNTYGVMEETANLVSVNKPTILKAYAVEEVLIRKNPIVIYNFVPFPVSDANEGLVPILFEDYFIGDKIRMSAKYGALQVSGQPIRIFGANLSIDNEGNEKVTSLQTSPQGA